MMKDHIYKEGKTKTDENTAFLNFADICAITGHGNIKSMLSDGAYKHHKYGEFLNRYTEALCRQTETDTYKVYGTKDELENWKYFVFNNKLPLFLNICLIIDQNNTSKGFIPWITNKKYTDDEIYKLLNINDEEQKLINLVIQKFERNSPWFKRYMTGTESI